MKKKPKEPNSEPPVVDEEILRSARSVFEEQIRPGASRKCEICAGEAAPTSTESLCWVCRRLKISAWRDSDAQLPLQE